MPVVSPLRSRATSLEPVIAPGEPIATDGEPRDLVALQPDLEEPPLPDEARGPAVAAATARTMPLEAGPEHVLHVRFRAEAGTERLVAAMLGVRELLRARPGDTRVVMHLPQGTGRSALPMELRTGVAYDAELPVELRRRIGDGLVDLQLA